MNELRWVFVCLLTFLFGNILLSAHAQAPEAATPKSLSPDVPIAPEKSVLTESAKQVAKPEAAATDLCLCVGQNESVATKRIEQALAGPLHSNGIDYADQPLQDVIAQLSDEYRISIHLDKSALEEAGIGTDSPVTINLHNMSLRSGVKLMLRPLQLTWIVQDEVLMITTRAEADKHFDTCVYNVRGLVDDANPKSMESLIEAIEACVASDTWSNNGEKVADIMPLSPGLLVVSQTPAIQEEVSSLLIKIRKMREQVPATRGRPQAPEAASSHSKSGAPGQSKTVGAPAKAAVEEDPFGG